MEEDIAGEEDMVCAIYTSLPTIQIISWVEHTMKPKIMNVSFALMLLCPAVDALSSTGGGGYMNSDIGGGFSSPGGLTGTPGGKDSKVSTLFLLM